MWLDEPHYCGIPIDEVPTDEPSFRYWLCFECGNQYKVVVGDGTWTTPDGRSGLTVSYQLMSRSRWN
jgi:hypothetical protein